MTYRTLDRLRKATQLATFGFLLLLPILLLRDITWILGSFYSLSIGELQIADPMMALQSVLTSGRLHVPLLLAAAVPATLALVLGRVFCSWACPQNTLSEWIEAAEKRLFRKRWQRHVQRPIEHNPRPVLYWGIFAGLVLLTLVAGFPLLGTLSMPGIISTQISQGFLGFGLGIELLLVAGILAVEIAVGRRLWCKYVCPVGACLSLFRAGKTLHLHHDPELCHCRGSVKPCHMACPLGLSPRKAGLYPFCFNCGRCARVCEKTGSRSLTLCFSPPDARSRERFLHGANPPTPPGSAAGAPGAVPSDPFTTESKEA